MKDAPHGVDEFGGESPIALGVDVTQEKFVLQSQFDFCGSEAYFSRHEVLCSSWAFVIEADCVAEEEAVRFPVDFHELIREGFCCSVGGVWVNRSRFVLGALGGGAEDLSA